MNISQMGALNNAIENSEKLEFASKCLSEEQLVRLYKSYKQLFWAQIAPAIILAVTVILELIFIPSEAVPHGEASMKETIILFETVFFIVPVYPIWIILTQFTFGKLWHKYSRWYRKKSSMDELYEMFG